MLVNTMLVEKQHPGLQKFCKTWFKGSEGKVRKKEAKENDADVGYVRRLPRPPRRTNKSAFRDRVNIRRLFHYESLFPTRERGFR